VAARLGFPGGPLIRPHGRRDYPVLVAGRKAIGFFASGQIKRVAAGGGDVLPICDLPRGAVANGAAWSRDGFIIFNAGRGPLLRVPATGGIATALTSLSKGEEAHEWPQLLPGGREVLYFAKAPQGAPENAIYIQNLASGKRDRVIQSFTRALWSPPGYLLFTRGESLLAQAIESRSHQLQGEAVTLAEDVLTNEANGRSTVAASENGMLVYRTSGGRDRQIAWHDRNGKSVAIAAKPGPYRSLALSPDGKTLAVLSRISTSNVDLWTIDLASGAMTEMTRNDRLEPSNPPVWSPDSQSVGVSPRGGGIEVVTVASAKTRVLTKDALYVQDWSPDRRSILCTDVMSRRVLLVPIDQPEEPRDILATSYPQWGFHYSPGGAAVVFISLESSDTAYTSRPFRLSRKSAECRWAPGPFPSGAQTEGCPTVRASN